MRNITKQIYTILPNSNLLDYSIVILLSCNIAYSYYTILLLKKINFYMYFVDMLKSIKNKILANKNKYLSFINENKIVIIRNLAVLCNNALERSVYACFNRYIHKPFLTVVYYITYAITLTLCNEKLSLIKSKTYKYFLLVILELKIKIGHFLSVINMRAKYSKNYQNKICFGLSLYQ